MHTRTHVLCAVQRDKAKESVAGYELRIKKYIEELKVVTGKASDSEAAVAKLRIEITESRKTVNEVRSDAPPGPIRPDLFVTCPPGSCSYWPGSRMCSQMVVFCW